ncbi:MAG: hypothetical protein ACI9WU_003438 [Myxococcota bacterium]|jgi:hypothetical protein
MARLLRFFVLLSSAALVFGCGPTGNSGLGNSGSGNSGSSSSNGSGSGDSGGETGQFDPTAGGTGDGTSTEGQPDGTGDGQPDGGGSGTDQGSTTGAPVFDGIAGFPSDELFLQIMGPSADNNVASGGGITYIAGILFGTADKIVWQSSSGQAGEADGSDFWSTGPITLAPGDNIIVVKAIDEAGNESEDTITITYNPGFHFGDRPLVRPAGFFTGQAVDVVVNMGIRTKNIVPSSVTLWEVDQDGNTLGKVGTMVDNGDTSNPSCDEIQDDQVFSYCASFQSDFATIKYVRVSLQVSVEGAAYMVFSPVVPVEIVEPISASECEQLHQVQKDAKGLFQSELVAGSATPGQSVLQMLSTSGALSSSGMNKDGHGIWVAFNNGLVGALNTSPEGFRGGQGGTPNGTQTAALVGASVPIQSKRVLALAPFAAEFGPTDEVPQIASVMQAQVCPEYEIDGPHQNGASTLARMRKAYEYGVVTYSGHADAYFAALPEESKRGFGWEHSGSQEILWTGDPVDCGALQQSMPACSTDADCAGYSECEITQVSGATTSGICVDKVSIDLRRGRVIMGAENWGVHPQFFPQHAARRWPSSLVYLGGCRTLFSGTLAGALFGVGAKAVAGYTDYVTSAFASEQGKAWFGAMLEDREASGTAMLLPVSDPANPAGQFALFGGSNVVITDSEILNAGFEKGDITGWNVDGDGRVVSQLGISIPVGGKFMGILSTGLGYTQQTGELNQSFCIPEGVNEMTLYWKFFSEEFLEWCGSIYQDTFQATLESNAGKISLVDVTVDDLCGAAECAGCGGQYVGLIPGDVSFDQGGVYNTSWQVMSQNVSTLAGEGPVTLRLFTTDAGDSIYDTVVLVDSIQFD